MSIPPFSKQLTVFARHGALMLLFILVGGCDQNKDAGKGDGSQPGGSYAIYAEFARDANVLMKDGLNRRVFNTTEAQRGADIALEKDGSITLLPGTYRMTGFSMVTLQAGLAVPASKLNLSYPGYGLVYERDFEKNDPLRHQIGVGSPGTALDMNPSLFDLVFTCEKVTQICVGHQSGDQLNNEVYLSVYEVDGIKSPFHVFARVAIFKIAP